MLRRISLALMLVLGALGFVVGSTASMSTAEACSCVPPHLPTTYHQSSDVFRGYVKKKFTFGPVTVYRVVVQKDFKGCRKRGDLVTLTTSSSSAACGASLALKKSYLITGNAQPSGVIAISLCGYNRLWNSLSQPDLKFLYSRQLCCSATGGCKCADGSQPVLCFADPCAVDSCPDATECIANYCGGCHAEFFDDNGVPACLPCSNDTQCPFGQMCQSNGECGYGCDTNADCPADEWCRPTQNLSDKECVPYQQEGEYCGGFTPIWAQAKCAPGLVCTDFPPFIADAPGKCRKPCNANTDCSKDQYCAGDGFCRDDGSCHVPSDCLLPGNSWVHIACVGYPTCSDMTCGWQCGQYDKCTDLADEFFGFCDMVLGYGVVNGTCQTISGCSSNGIPLFDSLSECKAACTADPCDDVGNVDFGPCKAIIGVGVINGQCQIISGCSTMGYPLFGSMDECVEQCGEADPCGDVGDVNFGPCLAIIGVGIIDGQCQAISGCSNMGYPLFGTMKECEKACHPPQPCDDVAGVDFGDCDAIVGVGVVNGVCQTISGCSDMGYPLFDTMEKCVEECGHGPCDDTTGVDFGPCDGILGWAVEGGQCVIVSGCGPMGYTLYPTKKQCQDACGKLQWYTTCGDPVCSGWKPKNIPLCTNQQEGNPCNVAGAMCDPQNFCNSLLMCTKTDPKNQGCPISRASKKRDVNYLDDNAKRAVADELLSFPLATWKYKAQGADAPERFGFLLDDVEPSAAVDGPRDMVDLYGYLSMTVAALQVQSAQIEELKTQLGSLQGELAQRPTCAPAQSPANGTAAPTVWLDYFR